jgi:uncharacterized protein
LRSSPYVLGAPKEDEMPLLPDRLPWFAVGPALGVLIVLLYALANRRLGVSGSYLAVRELVLARRAPEQWRAWSFVGIVAGAAVAAALGGRLSLDLSYGALGRLLPIAALVPVLFAGGVLIGYGARWADGCTSGHGMSGVASRSPASWAATATFFMTAVAVSLALHFVSGGAL